MAAARRHRFDVRLTDEELSRARDLAAELGEPLSEIVRAHLRRLWVSRCGAPHVLRQMVPLVGPLDEHAVQRLLSELAERRVCMRDVRAWLDRAPDAVQHPDGRWRLKDDS